MAGVGKPLHLRLFLEGVEVPVIAAQVQVGQWAPATAAIQIVPLDQALEFKPRTMVHLFYLEEPAAGPDKNTGMTGRAALALGVDGPLSDTTYKLFFAGEVVGFAFEKTPMSRAVILQCLDFSSYWDSAQATMMDYGPQGNAFVDKAAVYGSDSSIFANIPTKAQAEKIRSWLFGKAKTPGLDKVEGLAGGILNMVEIMGGLNGHTLGVNDFFTLAELRCHILGQISADEYDNTARRLLDIEVFFQFISNSFQNQPGQVSLREMLKLLCSFIYYSFVPNPIAKFDPKPDKPKEVKFGAKTIALSSHRNFGPCMSVIQDATYVFSLTSKRMPTLEEASNLGAKISSILLPKLKEMQKEVGTDQILAARAEQLLGEVNRFPIVFTVPDSAADVQRVCAELASSLFKEFDKASKLTVTQAGGSYKVDETARLRTQMFRPDCYMAAAPTCNVIFPEQYSQISYERNFLSEVTRVELSVYHHVVGQDALTAQHFLEPHLLDMSSAVVKQMGHKWRVLMDHERHTGIIAREEWLPDSFASLRQPNGTTAANMKQAFSTWIQRTGLHHFFKYRIGPRSMTVLGRFMPQVVCGFPAVVIQKPFFVRSDVTSDSIVDRIMSSTNPADELGAPPQFLGLVEAISHSLSQTGGNTTVSLSHCRSHLGIDDEFVGKVLDRVRQQRVSKHIVHSEIVYEKVKNAAEKEKNFLQACTPQNLPLVLGSAVTAKSLTAEEAKYAQVKIVGGQPVVTQKTASVKTTSEGKKKPGVGATSVSSPNPYGPAGSTVQIPAQAGTVTVGSVGLRGGVVKLITVHPPYQIIEETGDVGTGTARRYYYGVTVFEEISTTTESTSPVPVEYVVQPAWLSTAYDNENVGPKIYKPFFGCDSIVDAISLANTGSIPARQDEGGLYVSLAEDDAALKARIKDIHNKRNFYSIEKAVNLLAFLYGRVKSSGADVVEFVESYTKRPVATKLELLGSYDLAIGFKGNVPVATKGKMGFFTTSLHRDIVKKGNLIGLLDDPALKMSRMNEKQKSAVAASYDVRAEKLAKVEAYAALLKDGNRGHVG